MSKRTVLVCVLSLLAVGATVTGVFGQPTLIGPLVRGGTAGSQALGFNGLVLKIETEKPNYILGEPIVLYVTLTNTGTAAVGVLDDLEPEANVVHYMITKPGGAQQRFLPYVATCSDAGPKPLAPGQSITDEAKIFFGQNGWVFTGPGVYQVSATYLGRVNSNTLNLTVANSANKSDQDAAGILLGSREAQTFLYLEGGDHLVQGRADLQRISNLGAGSSLSPFADFALGTSLSSDFANFVTMNLRGADLPGANVILQRGAGRLPNSLFYSVGLLGQLSKNLRAQGNAAQATAMDTQLQQTVQQRFNVLTPHVNRLLLLRRVSLAIPGGGAALPAGGGALLRMPGM
jgi:hypothetical protein